MGKSFGPSNPHAKVVAFVMLCLSFTFWLTSHLTKIQASCFFQFSSSFNLSVVAWSSISVIYTSDSRAPCSCWVFVFMEGAISKLPSFTFHSLLYFPVALLDLEIIFSNFKSLLYFSWKWTVEFFFNICFPVCLFSWELLCDCHLMLLVSLEIHWGCLCLSDVYGLVVWCDY